MKPQKSILTVLLLFIALTAIAQQGINYKALIKDSSGNVVANQSVTIQFIIYQGVALTNNVYQESHTVNTDANGIVIVNIGKGTVNSGVFANINWGADQHFLNVQVNTGTGLVDLGTTEFMAVPYAKHATTAATATNITGLEKITEGANTGWRLIGRDPTLYGDIGNNATDLSFSNTTSPILGATGNYSTAMGNYTTASGSSSTAMGNHTTASGLITTAMGDYTTASGQFSIAMGNHTTASGNYSTAMGASTTASGERTTAMGDAATASGTNATAMGNNTTASGDISTAMGFQTKAESYISTVVGRYNLGGGSATSWTTTDPLFEIGNGSSSSNLSNALTVLKNGTITAPSVTNALITTAGAKALITKEYAETNLIASGLEKITEGGNTGRRLIGQNPANYGNIGNNAVDLSYSATNLTLYGATGNYSTAMGIKTRASGNISTSMGSNTLASGSVSTAMGLLSLASGDYSTAIGYFTTASSFASVAIGRYNIGASTDSANWVTTDPVFEIGNGLGNTTRSNALTVYKNGNTDVSGVIRASGNIWPTTGAGVEIAYDSSLNKGYIQSYDRTTSAWRDLVVGAFDIYPVKDNYTNLGITTNRWTAVYAVNGTIQTSDRRMKKEINNIKYGLKTVMQLRPVTYKWKKGNQDINLGLIAQEVQKLIPEIVDVGTDKDQTLGLKYTALIPVVIKATQEQQKIIEKQQKAIETQQKEIVELKKMVNKLLKQRILVSN
ncbi:tail fiber domain-containing protein [Lutibacter sp.]|uniref:tail fiber domain-containing protein n=1 Tax=Lutibacter sp. TaxID=1925666 RepID=UPI0025C6DE81|nr:tail fiber domain-containing protein [Lutibacter sp.]MCF6182597.1 tail fiber domain-containing protein [Lutibacter sp.]